MLGLSTQRFEQSAEALGITGQSTCESSQMARNLDPEVRALRNRRRDTSAPNVRGECCSSLRCERLGRPCNVHVHIIVVATSGDKADRLAC